MPKDMFGDVVEPSIKVGSQQWYTVPLSILVHTLLIGAVVIIVAKNRLAKQRVAPKSAADLRRDREFLKQQF